MTPKQRQRFSIIKPLVHDIFTKNLNPWDPQDLNATFNDSSDFIRHQKYLIPEIDTKHNYDDIQLMDIMFGEEDKLYIMYDAFLDGKITAMVQVEYINFIFNGFSVWDETAGGEYESKNIGEYNVL